MVMTFVLYGCLHRCTFRMQVKVTHVTPISKTLNLDATGTTLVCRLLNGQEFKKIWRMKLIVRNFLRELTTRNMDIKLTSYSTTITSTVDVFVAKLAAKICYLRGNQRMLMTKMFDTFLAFIGFTLVIIFQSSWWYWVRATLYMKIEATLDTAYKWYTSNTRTACFTIALVGQILDMNKKIWMAFLLYVWLQRCTFWMQVKATLVTSVPQTLNSEGTSSTFILARHHR